jgi:hypothetical protein
MTQKFHHGDLVRIADDLDEWMSHFQAGCDAIVDHSYADKYGGISSSGPNTQYSLHLKDRGKVAWYYEHQLTLVESNRADLLREWEAEEAAFIKEKSNLDWIFAHGAEVIAAPSGASAQALANCFGLTNLWGSQGEGFIYNENKARTMALARPFLAAGAKDAWLKFCAENEIIKGRAR